MPSPVGYDLAFGSLHQHHVAQLASSQLSQYLSDLNISSKGAGPFPLRSHAPRAMLHKSVSAPSSLLLTHSILSNRSGGDRPCLDRLDSLEDPGSASSPEELDELHPVQMRPWSRRMRPVKKAPILKHFYEFGSLEKKKVKFADDMGMDLERTRFFTDELDCWEPDPVPRIDWFRPKSVDEAIEDEDLVVEISEWQVNFSQPAADYLGFREKLETNTVGLENVIIKQKTNSFMGTIKVLNKSFKKDVFVRCTFNGWETFSDFPAKFCGKGQEAVEKYDTFSFEIIIPPKNDEKQTVEFCVGFRSDGKENWDSNCGHNFQLITNRMKQRKQTEKQADAYTIHNLAGSWSQFASWSHLDSAQPYY